MKVSVNKPVSLGILPGSVPPEMAWNRFDVRNDSGVVVHYIDDVQRAEIATENFAEYVDKNPHIVGVVVTVEKTPTQTTAAPVNKKHR